MKLYDKIVDILDKWLTLPFEAGQTIDDRHWVISIEFAEQGTLMLIFHRDKQTLLDVTWRSAW